MSEARLECRSLDSDSRVLSILGSNKYVRVFTVYKVLGTSTIIGEFIYSYVISRNMCACTSVWFWKLIFICERGGIASQLTPGLNFALVASYTVGRLPNLSVLWFLRDKPGMVIVLTSWIKWANGSEVMRQCWHTGSFPLALGRVMYEEGCTQLTGSGTPWLLHPWTTKELH